MLSFSEKRLFSLAHRAASIAFPIEPIHIAIEPILIELGKVLFEKIAQRTAAYPFAHG